MRKNGGDAFVDIKPKSYIIIIASSAFLAFGLYNVHSLSGVTEGGILGLVLLFDYWFGISPAISFFAVSAVCFAIGCRVLGKSFIARSAVAVASFSLSYALFEQFEPLWPGLYDTPLLAAVLGAVFVGVGTGMCVRENAAIAGDDALAMTLSHVTGIKIEYVYMLSDVAVLAMSLCYIPLRRIAYSLFTVILSGQIIGIIRRIGKKD